MSIVSEKPTKAQIEEALLRSGYLLESRLQNIFRKNGYYVDTNSAYPDPDTGKSRELDLYAMIAEKAGPEELDFIFAVLLVECVNNSQPLAFITKEPLVGFLNIEDIKLAGLPVMILGEKNNWESLRYFLKMDKYHHYCEGRIATQFCSFEKKRGSSEWMAKHLDEHFDAFQKLSAAVEYFIDQHFQTLKTLDEHETINIEFYYPVVVVQGELLDIRPSKKSLKLIPSDHIQYRRSAIIGKEEKGYQIDIVTERFFPKYLEIVDQELSKTARLFRRRRQVIRQSMNRIVQNARLLTSPEDIRVALEFPDKQDERMKILRTS